MDACMSGERRFGVTLIERGSEVGGGDIRAMAGTMAEIMRAEQLDDGRWNILVVGAERIRVHQWLNDDPYPRAQLEAWPDSPWDQSAEVQGDDVVRKLRHVLVLAVEAGLKADPMVELDDDPTELSYQISILAPFGALDRQRLLVAPGPVERLALAMELLDEQEDILRARLA
ncbi:MAG: LON peptidase substrate-binding domain-containing protein [Acidimicrobiales bacterium]|nr:LON peptidase substrate-binding domain-containing protein [Acidimicrobiales bacterium]